MGKRIVPPGVALLFLAVVLGLLVGILDQSDRYEPQVSRVTGQGGAGATQVADYESSYTHEPLWVTATIRTHWSDFVVDASVTDVEGPYFNTSSGDMPTSSYSTLEDAPGSPFDDRNPDATDEPNWQDNSDATAEAWTASGKEVHEWRMYRLAILDVQSVLKGITSTEKLVVILPGGRITDTTALEDEVYQESHYGLDGFTADDGLYAFTNDLAVWQVDYRSSYPIYDRCLDRAESLTGSGDEAYCQLLGAAYVESGGGYAWSVDLVGQDPLEIVALETEVAEAVATVPISSVLVYTDALRSNWPVVTPSPTP